MVRRALVLLVASLLGGCAVRLPPAGIEPQGSPRLSSGRAAIRDGVAVDGACPAPCLLERTATPAFPERRAGRPPPLGLSLGRGWTAGRVDAHVSHGGTPLVRGLLTEPAFLGRDLYARFRYAATGARTEVELDVDLEWALTRRLGIVAKVPFVWWELPNQSDILDVGDLGAGLRALLVETGTFLLSSGVGVNVPTSDDGDMVGANEWIAQPYVATWLDLGAWWTWQSRVGVDFLLRSDVEAFAWSTMLARSFPAPFLTVATHERCGVFSVFVEAAGVTVLSGPREGTSTAQGLVGLSHTVSDVVELRAGGFFPLTDDTALDWGIRFGAVLHL